MKKIASFSVNHDKLERGLYISRIDSDTITYDIRMKKPNNGDYISPKTLHTIEHLLATYVRNSFFSDGIVYAGPMGCRTGFYLIARDTISKKNIIKLLTDAFLYIAEFTGKIPGSEKSECGNYLEHNLEEAKTEAEEYLPILKKVTENTMTYKE